MGRSETGREAVRDGEQGRMSETIEGSPTSSTEIRKADIVGCWKLERILRERNGVLERNDNFGDNPSGFLYYTAENRVAVTIASGGRPDGSVTHANRRGASTEDLAAAALTFDAYSGRYSLISPDQIVHHVEVSLFQKDVGTDLVRGISIEGDLLTIFPPDLMVDMQPVKRRLEWRRVRAE